jgi:GDP-L-fucose synthase
MIRKFHEAKLNANAPVQLWGTGSPKREFLYVEDLAEAVVYALENTLDEHLYNVGSGVDLSIKELAEKIQKITGHSGEIVWDSSKPDGTPRKLMDISKLQTQGWEYKIQLDDGIKLTYEWFLENVDNFKEVKI